MPHLRLEYSSNLKDHVHFREIFPACHSILAKTANADVARCQSRAIPCDQFFVGDGSAREAFIALEIILLEGRSTEQLEEMGRQTLKLLENAFSHLAQRFNMQISVRYTEFPSSTYYKIETKFV